MEIKVFKSKVDWWVYAIIPFIILCCMAGPILTDSDYWFGIVLSIPFCILVYYVIVSTKYAVRGNEFGVKSIIGWQWFLKSSAPLEISPKDEREFIADLLRINPDINVSSAVKENKNSHI